MFGKIKTGQPVSPLPFPIYFWTVAAIAVGGLANSTYLAVSHYRVYMDIATAVFAPFRVL